MIKSNLNGKAGNDNPIDSSKAEAAVNTEPTDNVISGLNKSISDLCKYY
jgi:hypothetical protein